jgi:hypothetical protein
MLVIAHFLSR